MEFLILGFLCVFAVVLFGLIVYNIRYKIINNNKIKKELENNREFIQRQAKYTKGIKVGNTGSVRSVSESFDNVGHMPVVIMSSLHSDSIVNSVEPAYKPVKEKIKPEDTPQVSSYTSTASHSSSHSYSSSSDSGCSGSSDSGGSSCSGGSND